MYRIASCGGDRQLFLWDVGTGQIIRKFKGHEGAINAVRPDTSVTSIMSAPPGSVPWLRHGACMTAMFLCGNLAGTYHCACLLPSITMTNLGSHVQVAYGAGDQVLTTAGYDQAVNVWDCRANAFHALQTMRVFADSVTSVATTNR